MPLIRSDDVRQKFPTYFARRAFGAAVRSLVEKLSGGYVREVHWMTSVYMRRVNVWNVKGEKLPGHARGRGDARAQDPVVRRTRKRCLWRKVNGG